MMLMEVLMMDSMIFDFSVVVTNPDDFSYYTEVKAESLVKAADIGLKSLQKLYPEAEFVSVSVILLG